LSHGIWAGKAQAPSKNSKVERYIALKMEGDESRLSSRELMGLVNLIKPDLFPSSDPPIYSL
jgi:hypothetical protein